MSEAAQITIEDIARAFRNLPPGYYVKCAGCLKWKTNGAYISNSVSGPKCEECS